jgi:hypothetical protein
MASGLGGPTTIFSGFLTVQSGSPTSAGFLLHYYSVSVRFGRSSAYRHCSWVLLSALLKGTGVAERNAGTGEEEIKNQRVLF